MEELEIQKIRRQMLAKWVFDNYKVKAPQAAFIKFLRERNPDVTISQSEISGLLKDKSFAEKKARRIEWLAGMPNFYLDNIETRVVKKLGDTDAIGEILLVIYNQLDDAGKHKLFLRANDLLEQMRKGVQPKINNYVDMRKT